MKKQRGVGLVEVMVSITIGMLILVGVVQLYVTSLQTQRSQEGYSRIQENMRYITSVIGQDINRAGYLGCMSFDPEQIFSFLATESGKDGNTPQRYNYNGSVVSGVDGNGAYGSDTMSLRFFSSQSIPLAESVGTFQPASQTSTKFDNTAPYTDLYAQLEKWQIVVVSDCSRAHVMMITDEPGADGTVQFRRGAVSTSSYTLGQKNEVVAALNTTDIYVPKNSDQAYGRLFLGGVGAHFYEIRTSALGNASAGAPACSGNNPQACGFFRDGEEIVDGVSAFQVEYGWASGSNVRFGDAAAVNAADGWASVDRIKVDLTLSSLDASVTVGNDASRHIKKSFSQIFMLRNRPI